MTRPSRADELQPEFRILGPLEAVAGGRVLDLGSPKQRDLLAVLLINAGRVVSTAQLADEIWYGSPPDRPEPTLQAYVSRLRKVLGAERLVTRAPGYLLDVRPDDVDAARFERLLTSGRDAHADGEHERASALLGEALSLWRGRALDGVRVMAAEHEAARLEALRLDCVEERIESDLASGAGAELVAELQSLNAAEPLRERIAGQLAVALYRAGRQSDALDVMQRTANELREQLGIDLSPQLRALEESILRQEPVLEQRPTVYLSAEGAAPRTFIGRDDELSAIAAELDEPGLVTLTGLGGTGKTRLALAIGESRPDVEAIVRLAPLRDGELLWRTIAISLGVREEPGRRIEDLVRERLSSSAGVLVIDNCEHLVGDLSDVVLALRAACPDLRILATSREPVGLVNERVWSVPPMQPQDATKLFAERAALANPGVALPFGPVERICARVGGIPLAVELAAARTRVLSVEQIADRLADVVRTIDPDERLSSALSWAVDELDPSEQFLFDRLSVFVGSFTVDDAERVCPDDRLTEADVLAGVARLVEMSLLVAEPDGARIRYRMLEPVRQYGARRCAEPDTLAARHFAWVSETAHTDDDEPVDLILDDIRSALGWAISDGNDTSGGLELACVLSGIGACTATTRRACAGWEQRSSRRRTTTPSSGWGTVGTASLRIRAVTKEKRKHTPGPRSLSPKPRVTNTPSRGRRCRWPSRSISTTPMLRTSSTSAPWKRRAGPVTRCSRCRSCTTRPRWRAKEGTIERRKGASRKPWRSRTASTTRKRSSSPRSASPGSRSTGTTWTRPGG